MQDAWPAPAADDDATEDSRPGSPEREPGDGLRLTPVDLLEGGDHAEGVMSLSREPRAAGVVRRLTAVLLPGHPVDDQQQAEQDLQRIIGAPAAILDALPAHIALLDPDGRIIIVNQAWIDFARRNGYRDPDVGVGRSYLEACDRAAAAGAEEAALAADGVREVLTGRLAAFELDYACHAPGARRWFRLMVSPVAKGGVRGAVVSHVDITERKTAELALQETQLKHDLALRSAGVGTWYWQRATETVGWDQYTHQIFGLEPGTFAGTTAAFYDLVHPEDRAQVLREGRSSVHERRPFEVEFRVLWPEGSLHWVASRGEVTAGGDGQILEMKGACWEVTERRQAENALKRRLALEALLAALSPRLGRAGDEQFAGEVRQALERVGEFIGADAVGLGVFHDDGRSWEMAHEWVRDASMAGQSARMASSPYPWAKANLDRLGVVKIPDFSRLPPAAMSERVTLAALSYRAAMAVPLVNGGAVFGFAGCSHREPREDWRDDEVLLLRLAGEMIMGELLRRQEARGLAALARVGRELITLVDAPAILDRACQLAASVLPSDIAAVFALRPEASEYVPASQHGLDPETWHTVQLLRFPRGHPGPRFDDLAPGEVICVDTAAGDSPAAALQRRFGVSAGLYVRLLSGERTLGLLAAFRRGRAGFFTHEVRIARGIAQLASFALANARLIEELGQANRVKSDFIATRSHELRTPLNIILGYDDLLLENAFGPLNEEQAEGLRRIGRSGRSLLRMIEATLSVARIDAGQAVIECADVDPATLLSELESETVELREKDAVRFVWRLEPDLPPIFTDGPKLKLVLRNLLDNAAKFTPAGRVEIGACASRGGVCFSVADTGVGIAPEVMPVIFDSFRQGDGSVTRQYGGVGLGLYIVHRLLELLGGRVEVESEVGKGSTFRVWMPLRSPGCGAP